MSASNPHHAGMTADDDDDLTEEENLQPDEATNSGRNRRSTKQSIGEEFLLKAIEKIRPYAAKHDEVESSWRRVAEYLREVDRGRQQRGEQALFTNLNHTTCSGRWSRLYWEHDSHLNINGRAVGPEGWSWRRQTINSLYKDERRLRGPRKARFYESPALLQTQVTPQPFPNTAQKDERDNMVPLEQQQAHPPNGTTYPNPLPTPSNGDTRQALQDGPQDHRHQASQPARSYSSGSQPKELYAMGAPLEQQASPGLSTDSTQQPTPPVTSATLAISATPCVQAPQPERSLATGTPCQQAEPHKSMRYQPQASGVYSMVSSGPQSSGKFNVSSPGPQLPRPYNMMPLESQSSSTYAMVLQEWQQQRAHSMVSLRPPVGNTNAEHLATLPRTKVSATPQSQLPVMSYQYISQGARASGSTATPLQVPSSSISRNASLHKPHQAHQDPVPPPLSISSSFQPVLEQRGYSSFKSVLETNVQRRNGCAEITPQLQRTSTPDGTESPSLQPAGPNEAEPDETSAATQQRVEEQQALQQRQSMGAIAETSNYNKEPEEEHVEKLKEEQTDGQEEELFLDGRESLVSSGNPSDIVPPEPQYSEGQEPGLQLDMVGSCLSSETQSDTIPPVSQHIDGPVSEPALNAGEPSSLDDILFSVHQDAVGPEPEPLLDANEASSSPWSSDAIVPQVRQRTEEPMDQAESSSPDTANQREDSTNNVPLTEFLSTKDYPNRKRTRFDDLDEVTQLYSSARTRVQTDAEAHTPTHAQTRTLAHMTTQTLAHMATQTLAHVATQTLKHAEAQTDPELQPESQSAMRAKTQVRAEEQEQGQEDSNSWDSQRILQGLQATQAKQLKLQKRQIKLQHKKVKMQKAQLAMDKAREEADERRHREMLIMMATLAQDQRVIENE